MDPNVALKNARDALATYQNTQYKEDAYDALTDLAYAFEALDAWLTGGGFLPNGWAR